MAHMRRGGQVLGICGGFQMLGRRIADPGGVEGAAGSVTGLGLIEVETVLTGDKTLCEVSGTSSAGGTAFTGYEMHVGRTHGADTERPMLVFSDGRGDGAVDASGRVAGCYVHGLFATEAQRAHWLQRIGGRASGLVYDVRIDDTLDALAAHLERHVRVDRLLQIAR